MERFSLKQMRMFKLFQSAQNTIKPFFFELDIESTDLAVSNGANIAQQELIAKSTKPIVFYVKENEEITTTCLYIDQLVGRIKWLKILRTPQFATNNNRY